MAATGGKDTAPPATAAPPDGLSDHGYKEIMEQYDLKERDLEEVISDLEIGMKKVEGMLNLQ